MISTDLGRFSLHNDRFLARLRRWVECESPTFDAGAMDSMLDLAESDLQAIGANVVRSAGTMGYAGHLLATFPHPRAHEPGILIMGHVDTVHPVGTIDGLAWRIEGDACYGPGVADMKGGVCLVLETVNQLNSLGAQSSLPLSLLLTGDEEAGSPTTRCLIEAHAARNKYVLVPEPGRPDGSVVIGRHPVSRYALLAKSNPGHAGAIGAGRPPTALRTIAEKIIRAEELSDEYATCTVATCATGRWSNCVPAYCEAEALVVASSTSAMERISLQLEGLASTAENVEFRVEHRLSRPEWMPSDSSMDLFGFAGDVAEQFGFHLRGVVAAGGSDGNFTGALGVATLDGLGPVGRLFHTLEEHILLTSLNNRSRLIAGLITTLK